jgi:hypothetical protein
MGGKKMDTATELQNQLNNIKTDVTKLTEFLKEKECHAQRHICEYTEYWQAVLSTIGEVQEYIKKTFTLI